MTISYAINGTSSEDTNVGRWVERAKDLLPEVAINLLTKREYVRNIAGEESGKK